MFQCFETPYIFGQEFSPFLVSLCFETFRNKLKTSVDLVIFAGFNWFQSVYYIPFETPEWGPNFSPFF